MVLLLGLPWASARRISVKKKWSSPISIHFHGHFSDYNSCCSRTVGWCWNKTLFLRLERRHWRRDLLQQQETRKSVSTRRQKVLRKQDLPFSLFTIANRHDLVRWIAPTNQSLGTLLIFPSSLKPDSKEPSFSILFETISITPPLVWFPFLYNYLL